MKKLGLIAAWIIIGTAAPAHAGVVAVEDFEGSVTGWTNLSVADPGPNGGGFTKFLGRNGRGETSSKTFALSGTQTAVNIAFDFYRIDSWDDERFTATATDGVNSVSVGQTGRFDDGGPTNIFDPRWSDRVYPLSFSFNTAATSFTLTFSSNLDQTRDDEAWGVDNLSITDNAPLTSGAVPEPATWAMMIIGFGAAGSIIRRRRAVIA